MPNGPTRLVRTGVTLFGILRAVSELDEPTPAEIAEHQNLARSTVYDHLATLRKERFVAATDAGYVLGLKHLDYGIQARNRFKIADVARPTLEHLAEVTDGLASLYVEEHGKAVCLDEVKGERAVLTVEQSGKAVPLHAISPGKVFLAEKSVSDVDEYVQEYGLEELTKKTIADPDTLREDLAQIRERGYALNDEETIMGLRAVSVPVYRNEVLEGALAVAGPSKWLRETRRDEIVDSLLEAANELELKLTYEE